MKITTAESRVLDVLWRDGALDAAEATAALAGSENWGEATVRTLLRRLIAKKAVAKGKDGRRVIYRPLIAQADVAQSESEMLIDRFFEGRLSPLVMQFSERRKLSAEDLAELEALIGRLKDGQ